MASQPDKASPAGSEEPSTGVGLGTFGGVFTPSVLTILGLVLFLRLGFVTGSVGLGQMLLILLLSVSVSLLTTISLAAIATNLQVGGGGVYFLMSRTLGPTTGGAIGLVLYLAMSVSVAFYVIGLGEAVAAIVGVEGEALPRLVAAGTIVVLLGIAWLGADIATRFQYVVMVLLTVAIIAFFIGVVPEVSSDRLVENFSAPSGGPSFWVTFAIFFPAITGFTQGVAMSGDLKTPSKSITVGTFAAIGVAVLVYLAAIVSFAGAVPLVELREDTNIMRSLSLHPALIDLGVVAATLSSAITSMLGAPRTLQRIAADGVVRRLRPLAKTAGPEANPRRAVVVTAGIALATVALGDIDVVAPVISMFFLASYGIINYATYAEARALSTSFRPRFRFFDWRLSLLGSAACVAVIVAIDPVAGSVAGVAVFALHRYLSRSAQTIRWADSTRGFHASKVRSHLRLMSDQLDAGRDWRPVTIAFVSRDPDRRRRLLEISSWLEGGSGFTTAVRVIPGRGAVARRHADLVKHSLQREIELAELAAYARVVVASDATEGISAMIQAHGLGAVQPNLALFSWYAEHDTNRMVGGRYEAMVKTAIRFGSHVAIAHTTEELWDKIPQDPKDAGRITVWWADDSSGKLLTMLAWMVTRTPHWSGSTIDVWVAQNGDTYRPAQRVAELIDDARIDARVRGAAPARNFTSVVGRSNLVFAPLTVGNVSMSGPGGRSIDELVAELPTVVFAQAAGNTELDVQPDENEMTALAAAMDRATKASEEATHLDQKASGLVVEAELARMDGSPYQNGLNDLAKRASQAQVEYRDALTQAEEAWRLVREIAPEAPVSELDPKLWLDDPDIRLRGREPQNSE